MKKQERLGKNKKMVLYILLYCESKGAKGTLKRDILKLMNQARGKDLLKSNLQLALDAMEQQELIKTELCELPETGRIRHRYCELTDKGREIAKEVAKEMTQ